MSTTTIKHLTFTCTTIFALSLLSACTVGPDYQPPTTVNTDSLKHHQGWQPLPEQSWANSGQWWQAFEDDTLNTLIEQANNSNQTLAQAAARYRAALAQRSSSRSAYSPMLGATLNQSRSDGSGGTVVSERANATLNISWEPDLWGRVRRQVEADTASVDSSAADLAAAHLSIQLAVINSYINLRALDQQKQILDKTLASSERSAELTRNQYDAGIVSRADVIQAETQLQLQRSDIYDLQNQRAIEENTIAVLLGIAPVNFSLLPAAFMPSVPAIPEQIPGQLIARRPDVVAAERSVAAANAGIGVAIAAWLPEFTISANRGVSGDSISDLWNAPIHFWSVGPGLSQLIFDGGKRQAAKDAAIARYDEQVAAYRQTVLEGLRDIENALATTTILREKVVQQDKLVKLAEENERVISNRYKSGLVSFLEVAIAQNTTLNARRGQISVTTEQLSAAAELAASIGGSWQTEG
ncbi:MAG: efflux transporter outer membrane subunit [Parahaliea sp.]